MQQQHLSPRAVFKERGLSAESADRRRRERERQACRASAAFVAQGALYQVRWPIVRADHVKDLSMQSSAQAEGRQSGWRESSKKILLAKKRNTVYPLGGPGTDLSGNSPMCGRCARCRGRVRDYRTGQTGVTLRRVRENKCISQRACVRGRGDRCVCWLLAWMRPLRFAHYLVSSCRTSVRAAPMVLLWRVDQRLRFSESPARSGRQRRRCGWESSSSTATPTRSSSAGGPRQRRCPRHNSTR